MMRMFGFWAVPVMLLIVVVHDLTEHHGFFRKPQVASLMVNGRVVSAMDDQRHELWRKEFPEPLDPRAYAGVMLGPSPRWLVEDLNGDGSREVVFVEARAAPGSPHRLHVLDSAGTVQWTFPVQGQKYPEFVTMLRTVPLKGGGRAVFAHFCRLPKHDGTLNLISAQGKVLTQFQHGGHLEQIAVSGDVVLLGGQCGRSNSAEVHQMRLLSKGGVYDLHAEHQFLFPRSCVNRLMSKSSRVSGLTVLEDGYLVAVAELIDEMPYEVYHELDRNFTTRRCWASEAFLELHQRLEMEKRIQHDFSPDEEARLCTTSSHAP